MSVITTDCQTVIPKKKYWFQKKKNSFSEDVYREDICSGTIPRTALYIDKRFFRINTYSFQQPSRDMIELQLEFKIILRNLETNTASKARVNSSTDLNFRGEMRFRPIMGLLENKERFQDQVNSSNFDPKAPEDNELS